METYNTDMKDFDVWLYKVKKLLELKYDFDIEAASNVDFVSLYEKGITPNRVVNTIATEYGL
jgi:hypothetical protein